MLCCDNDGTNACILFLCNGLTTAVINIYYWFLQNESKLEKNPNRSEISLVSEWLLFKVKWAIFQLYHNESKLLFNKMMLSSRLSCLILDFYSAS